MEKQEGGERWRKGKNTKIKVMREKREKRVKIRKRAIEGRRRKANNGEERSRHNPTRN